MLRIHDLCPCGSGKSYRRCCWRKKKVTSLTLYRWAKIAEGLRTELSEYAQSGLFDEEGQEAFDAYCQFNPTVLEGDEEARDLGLVRFLEWFVHDYPLDSRGKTLLECFIEQVEEDLTLEEVLLLADWSASYAGVYQVRQVDPGESLVLTDLLLGGESEVVDIPVTHQAQEGQVLVGRLVRFSQDVFEFGGSCFVLSSEVGGQLVKQLWAAYTRAQQHEPGLEWPRFLRSFSHRVPGMVERIHRQTPRPKRRTDSRVRQVEDLFVQTVSRAQWCEEEVRMGVEIWRRFVDETGPHPRRPEVWAAALEYTLIRLRGKKGMTQREVADRYAVSASSISGYYREICQALKLGL